MAKKLTGWFQGVVECNPQTVDFILPRMALTFADPKHGSALKGSCHQLATRFIREQDRQRTLKDDDRIIQVGAFGKVFHTIIAGADDSVRFDSFNPKGESGFKPDRKKYVMQDIDGELDVMSDITVADFKKDYVARLVLPPPAATPPPSTP